MPENAGAWSARRWGSLALVLAAAGAIIYLIVSAWAIVAPFAVGLIVGYLILPIVDWLARPLARVLHRPGVARLLAILIVYAVALGLIAALIAYLVPVVEIQVQELAANREAVSSQVQRALAGLRQWYETNVPPGLRELIGRQLQAAAAGLLAGLASGLRSALTSIGNTLYLLFGYVAVPFWLIYLLYDAGRVGRALRRAIPEGAQPDLRNLRLIFDEVVVAYVRGQLLVAAILGALSGLGLSLLGVDFAVLLGLITAIGDLIPTVGPYLAAIPTVLIAGLEEPILALWAVLVLLGVQQIEALFLVPRIIGESVRLRPAIIIVLLVIAGALWGLLGLLLVVPATAFLRDVVYYLFLWTEAVAVSPGEALRRVQRMRLGA